jgi:hypothetical protein
MAWFIRQFPERDGAMSVLGAGLDGYDEPVGTDDV